MAKGIAVIDFGAFPGATEASVVITGQGAILATAYIEIFIMREATSDHSIEDHSYASLLSDLTGGAIVAGTGFTIFMRSLERLQGTYNLRWVWSAA